MCAQWFSGPLRSPIVFGLVNPNIYEKGAVLAKLGKDEIVTIQILHEKRVSNCEIAQKLGVSEGAVRYHLRRKAQGAIDGRKKRTLIEKYALEGAVELWWRDQEQVLKGKRPPSIRALFDYLIEEHAFRGSYKAIRSYARSHFPAPKKRPHRRVETPPGVQTQTDWFEAGEVTLGFEQGPVKLYGFVMVLSHSRKAALIWSRSMDQLAWHHCHNEAYKRLGGVASVNRIDNLKTGIGVGAGPWGQVNAAYKVYARTMGFHVDACEPGCPKQKGKVENRVGHLERLNVSGRSFESLEQLQQWTDTKVEAMDCQRICVATGLTVAASWDAEKKLLRALPIFLPKPFDLVRQAPVHDDCLVCFEGRRYEVPFEYVDRTLEVRGCSGTVQIVNRETGRIVASYPRHSMERLLLLPDGQKGQETDRLLPPKPLGRMARKIQQLAAEEVQRRSVQWYAELAEVAR